jgi:hypothetical protein
MHKCEFSTEWSKDETSHWHACVNEKCDKTSDKADHTWDDGVITTTATQKENGVKTFTCTVCEHTKTEPVEFTGLSRKEWNATLDYSVFENVSYKETSTVKYSGVTVESETEYKIKKTMARAKITIAGQSEQDYTSNLTEVNTLRTQLVDSIKSIAKHDKFEYDAETKTYKATEAITIAALGASTSDITITFADDKLAEIKYTASFTQNGIDFYVTSTVTLYDYGTTVVAGTTT